MDFRFCQLFLLAFGITFIRGDELPTPIFSKQPDNYFSRGKLYYRVMLLDPQANAVYVGAMNTLYKLDMENINRTADAKFRELELKPDTEALATCSGRTRDQELKCQNHVKSILKQGDGNLFICSTNALSPSLKILDGKGMRILKTGMSGAAICPSDPDDRGTAVWVDDGNPGNIPSPYSATVTDYTGSNRVIYRPPLQNGRGETQASYMSTIYTDSKWLKEPTFVASFDVGDGYVYFFFQEQGMEYSSCDPAFYSRVARVCKSDTGGRNLLKQTWTSFVKARLNCSLSGDFPFHFNEIQDVYKVESASRGILFYATFTTGKNGPTGSAICIYSLNDIRNVFERSRFKSQASPSHVWEALPETDTPTPRPGQCVKDSKMLSDTALHFAKSHTLMDKAITPIPSRTGFHDGPIFYRKDVMLTKLVVDNVQVDEDVFPVIFAGTETGEIYSIVTWSVARKVNHGNLIAVYKLPSAEPIRSLGILQERFLYIAQDDNVAQIHVSQCQLFQSCTSCAQSPYCVWDSLMHQCIDSESVKRDGRIRFNVKEPMKPVCTDSTRKFTKLLYPGDSFTMSCHQRREKGSNENSDSVWLFNNRSINLNDRGLFLTVDNTLVIVNVTKKSAGLYECFQQRNKLVSYNILVDEVSCHKPQTIQAFYSVYQEWCREFQEYKVTMIRWKKWYDQNLQCGSPLDRRKLNMARENEFKSNRLTEVKK